MKKCVAAALLCLTFCLSFLVGRWIISTADGLSDLNYQALVDHLFLLEEDENTYTFVLIIRPAKANFHDEYLLNVSKRIDYDKCQALLINMLIDIRSAWINQYDYTIMEAWNDETKTWDQIMGNPHDATFSLPLERQSNQSKTPQLPTQD